MNVKRAITGAAIIGGVVIALIALSLFHDQSGSGNCIPSTPHPLFYLENSDADTSHVVRAIIATPENRTLATETYVMKPAGSVGSQFRATTKVQETFFVTFIVDNSSFSQGTVGSTPSCSDTFFIDPDLGVLFTSRETLCRDMPCSRTT